jgi:hypothetical protein
MSKDIPLAISRAGGQTQRMFNEPYIQPVDWKKEAEAMRIGAAKILKNKRTAHAFFKKVGFDLKTGKLIRPGNK